MAFRKFTRGEKVEVVSSEKLATTLKKFGVNRDACETCPTPGECAYCLQRDAFRENVTE